MKIFLIVIPFLFFGCSHLSLKVISDQPESEVFIHTSEGSQKLGVTPLEIKDDVLERVPPGFTIEVSKSGFYQTKVLVEKRSLSSKGEIKVKLKEMPKIEAKINDPDVKAVIEEIARNVSSIQSFLLKRNYNQAEVMTKTLLNKFPHLSVAWNLLGNNYYLQGRFDEASENYRKALEIEPTNQETRDVLKKMNRLPASMEK